MKRLISDRNFLQDFLLAVLMISLANALIFLKSWRFLSKWCLVNFCRAIRLFFKAKAHFGDHQGFAYLVLVVPDVFLRWRLAMSSIWSIMAMHARFGLVKVSGRFTESENAFQLSAVD